MKDINQQIHRGNQIIGSILKDEVDSLPILLKNYIPGMGIGRFKENNINAENYINNCTKKLPKVNLISGKKR